MFIIEHKPSRNSAWKRISTNKPLTTEAEAIAYARMFDEDGIWPIPGMRIREIDTSKV